METGAMNSPFKRLLGEAELIGELGFDYLELGIEAPYANPPKVRADLKRFQDIISVYNLDLLGHLPWYFEIAYPYERVRKALLAECVSAFKLANDLDIEFITFHPDIRRSGGKFDRKAVMERTQGFVDSMLAQATEYGITLSLENIDDKIMDLQEMREVFEKFPQLKFTLDVGHANLVSPKGERVKMFIEEFGDRLAHLHFSDNKGEDDDHLPLGVGFIKWTEIVHLLKKAGFDETITLEVHAPDRDYLRISREKLEALWNDA